MEKTIKSNLFISYLGYSTRIMKNIKHHIVVLKHENKELKERIKKLQKIRKALKFLCSKECQAIIKNLDTIATNIKNI